MRRWSTPTVTRGGRLLVKFKKNWAGMRRVLSCDTPGGGRHTEAGGVRELTPDSLRATGWRSRLLGAAFLIRSALENLRTRRRFGVNSLTPPASVCLPPPGVSHDRTRRIPAQFFLNLTKRLPAPFFLNLNLVALVPAIALWSGFGLGLVHAQEATDEAASPSLDCTSRFGGIALESVGPTVCQVSGGPETDTSFSITIDYVSPPGEDLLQLPPGGTLCSGALDGGAGMCSARMLPSQFGATRVSASLQPSGTLVGPVVVVKQPGRRGAASAYELPPVGP
jgi:hypothetical protein